MIEEMKLEAVSLLNRLQRTVSEAVLDHYALYIAHRFLKESELSAVLTLLLQMRLGELDSSAKSKVDTNAILDTLNILKHHKPHDFLSGA